jgi:predicted secreted acid phosphatase
LIKALAAVAALAFLPRPVLAQTPQPPLQQQVDAAQGEINRVITSMATLIMQQNAEIAQLQAQLKKPERAASAPLHPPKLPEASPEPEKK